MNPSHRFFGFVSFTVFLACTGLLCCTLPILLVSLGIGTMMASMASTFTWLPLVSEYKFWIFLISGLLFISAELIQHRQNKICPADPKLAKQCAKFDKLSSIMLNIGLIIWLVGFISAYLLFPLSLMF